MSTPEISSVLAQMRVLSQELHSPTRVAQPDGSFVTAMQQAIIQVNNQQSSASALVNQLEAGSTDTSIAEVMVAMQKASVSFQAMTEVRNRLVEAYREVMSMPL